MTFTPHKALGATALSCLVLLAGLVVSVVAAPPAWACDEIPVPQVTHEHIAADDLNEPNSAMAQEFRSYEFFENEPVPQLLGAYLVETVAVIEGDAQWYQASVSTVQLSWGQAPESILPIVHFDGAREPIDGVPCDVPGDGPDTGEIWFMVVTDLGERELFVRGAEDPLMLLTDVFGPPRVVERQGPAVQEALDSINLDQRSTALIDGSIPQAASPEASESAASSSGNRGGSGSVSVGIVPYIVGLLLVLWVVAVVQHRRRI